MLSSVGSKLGYVLHTMLSRLKIKILGMVPNIIETMPLPVFLIYSRLIEPVPASNWIGPYLSSCVLALISTVFLIWKKRSLNRCFVGINVYFFVGCIGLLTRQDWLNSLMGELEAAGMLASIFVVGVYYTYFSASGFLGVSAVSPTKIRQYSLMMLVTAFVALTVSFFSLGNMWMAEVIPFVSLFVIQGRLKSTLAKHINAG